MARNRLYGAEAAKHAQRIRGSRRETLYKMISKRSGGVVACFVCGRHVPPNRATLEHVVPRRDGGTDDMDNLAISHGWCNSNRDQIEAKRASESTNS